MLNCYVTAVIKINVDHSVEFDEDDKITVCRL